MKNQTPKRIIDNLLTENVPRYSPGSMPTGDREPWVASFRSALSEGLGIPPLSLQIDRLDPLGREDRGDYLQETFLVRGAGDFPLTLLTPREDRRMGISILAIYGHGPGVSAMTGEYEPEECHHHFGRILAEAGFNVILPEVIGFGDCRLDEDRETAGMSSCLTLAMQLLPLGYSLSGLRLWQLETVLGLAEERFGTERLGCFGFSGGGLLGYMLTALDQRIKALGLAGYCSTFEESIYEHTHCADNYIPGLFRISDQPEIAHLIAPRPLYVEAGLNDPVFPVKGARIAMERMGACYELAGCREKFITHMPDGGHEIQGRDMIRWYGEVL